MSISITAFDDCSLPREAWNHRAHLTVAYLLLRAYPPDEATRRMCEGVKKYNAAHGIEQTPTGGYHETLTIAWMRIVGATMRAYGPGGADAGAEPTVEAFLDHHTQLHSRVLLRLYYSRERIMSAEARRGWMEPDLAPLPKAP